MKTALENVKLDFHSGFNRFVKSDFIILDLITFLDNHVPPDFSC